MTNQWNILSGPSKYDLMESLFNQQYPGTKIELKIQREKGKPSEVRKVEVWAIRKHGSFDSHVWGFFGCMEHASDRPGYTSDRLPFPVIGEYSTGGRSGEGRIGTVTEMPENFRLPI